MAQQLLDGAQVRAALQKVRGERVAERVRGHAGAAARVLETPPHVRGREPSAALREEQRGLYAAGLGGAVRRQLRARAVEVALERPPGRLARGNDARLRSLAR